MLINLGSSVYYVYEFIPLKSKLQTIILTYGREGECLKPNVQLAMDMSRTIYGHRL